MSDKTILEQWRAMAYDQQADRTGTFKGEDISISEAAAVYSVYGSKCFRACPFTVPLPQAMRNEFLPVAVDEVNSNSMARISVSYT